MFADFLETCYVYIAVSLKINDIASNSTLKCAFQGGMLSTASCQSYILHL